MTRPMRQSFSLVLAFCFFATSLYIPAAHSAELTLPQPGTMVPMSVKSEPAMMVGMQVDPKDPFKLNFIMDKGEKTLSKEDQTQEFSKVIKYFLASLTVPNNDMWVTY